MTNKKYKSVSEMLHDTSDGDSSLVDEFDAMAAKRHIIKDLVALRVAKGLSQADIAKHMDCSQSRVSKLESGLDADLRLGDLAGYLSALGLSMKVGGVPNEWSIVDEIKQFTFAIKSRLLKLARLANGDDSVARGVANFYADAFCNFNKILKDAVDKLPHRPDDKGPYIDVSFQKFAIIDDADCDDDDIDMFLSAECSDRTEREAALS